MKIHFIGIGGIGVSGLAQYYLARGQEVSGSDLVRTEITDLLKQKGATIFIGPHSIGNLKNIAMARKLQLQLDKSCHGKKITVTHLNNIAMARKFKLGIDLVVYSPAVQQDNIELKSAREQGVKCQSYPEALGELTKKYFTIAVSGTHGKSTTAAMLSLILIKAGLDPTVIIGTKLKEFGNSNFRPGKSKYLVIEADEWQASFLNYSPKIIVLTNIEREHLDYYRDMEHILETYREYVGRLPKEGTLVLNVKCQMPNAKSISNVKCQNFSISQPEAEKLGEILKVPGEHNVVNALAALTTARALNIPDKISFAALTEYKGSWRRFEEKKIRINNQLSIIVISDYAHHPTEIAATLKAAKGKYPNKAIWCIFQPHQYQRTFYLFDDFVRVFQENPVQKVIITDIYDVAGREAEEIKEKVSAKKLIEAIEKPWAQYMPKDKIKGYLKKNLEGREVVIVMGAGDIYQLVEQF